MIYKKRNLLILIVVLTAVVFYFFQVTFVNYVLKLGPYCPDLLAILTAFVGFRLGPAAGATCGFWTGLWLDMMTGFYGPHALVNTLSGFGASFFTNQRVLLVERYYFPAVMVILGFFQNVVLFFIHSLGGPLSWMTMLVEYALVNALYFGLFAFLLLMLIPTRWTGFVRYDVKYEL